MAIVESWTWGSLELKVFLVDDSMHRGLVVCHVTMKWWRPSCEMKKKASSWIKKRLPLEGEAIMWKRLIIEGEIVGVQV